MKNMYLHCGANLVPFQEVQQIETPEPQGRWFPVPHDRFVEDTKKSLEAVNLEVIHEEHGLWKNGMRYFGLLELKASRTDFSTLVGLRNSHDKSFVASLVCGQRVFVCDNLAFSGEIYVARKHTTNILRDLAKLTNDAVSKLAPLMVSQERRVEIYESAYINDTDADHLILQAMRNRIIVPRIIPYVVKEWDKPSHEEFQPRNIWSLFNSFTSVLKINRYPDVKQSVGLHGMFDAFCGFDAVKEVS